MSRVWFRVILPLAVLLLAGCATQNMFQSSGPTDWTASFSSVEPVDNDRFVSGGKVRIKLDAGGAPRPLTVFLEFSSGVTPARQAFQFGPPTNFPYAPDRIAPPIEIEIQLDSFEAIEMEKKHVSVNADVTDANGQFLRGNPETYFTVYGE